MEEEKSEVKSFGLAHLFPLDKGKKRYAISTRTSIYMSIYIVIYVYRYITLIENDHSAIYECTNFVPLDRSIFAALKLIS